MSPMGIFLEVSITSKLEMSDHGVTLCQAVGDSEGGSSIKQLIGLWCLSYFLSRLHVMCQFLAIPRGFFLFLVILSSASP